MPFWSWCFSNKSICRDDGADGDALGKSKASGKSKAPVAAPKSPDELFNAYAEAADPDTIGAEGLQRLCAEANIPMDGAQPLLLSWQLDANEFGSFKREEWTKNLDELQYA